MEEKLDRLEKSVGDLTGAVNQTNKHVADLTEIAVSIKEYIETNLATKQELTEVEQRLTLKMATKQELADTEERLGGKIEGLQRGLDAQYERHSELEARVTKLEGVQA